MQFLNSTNKNKDLPPHLNNIRNNNNNNFDSVDNNNNKKEKNSQIPQSEKYDKLKYDYNFRMSSGVLLLLGCPELMQFGLDNSRWKIGPKFMGIKLIPLGPHYVNYSLSDEEYAIKQGFFIDVNKSKLIHIRKWDKDLEEFVVIKEENEKNFSIGISNLEFDAFLGNYPNNQYDNWSDLTNFIKEDIISKIQPISRKYISASKEYDNDNDIFNIENKDKDAKKFNEKINLKKTKNNEEDISISNEVNETNKDNTKEIPKKKINKNENFAELQENLMKNLTNNNSDCLKSNLYFTEIPKNKTFLATEKIENSLITKNNIDKSFIFEELLFKELKGNEDNFLGEFQFSFITFFISEIYESFEQWKNLCLLFLNCKDVVNTKNLFFYKFVQVLYNQLRQFPKDFFVDEITSNNFFKKSLENFIIYIKELETNNSNTKLKKSVEYFEKFLSEYFGFFIKDENEKIIEKYLNPGNDTNMIKGFKFDEEEDDELPVIVNEEEINEIMNRQIDSNVTMDNNNNEENTQNNTDLDAEAEAEIDILMENNQQENDDEYMELDKF